MNYSNYRQSGSKRNYAVCIDTIYKNTYIVIIMEVRNVTNTLNVRMDKNLKKQFDALCAEFGMTASTAVTIFAKTIVRERRIPFEIKVPDPFYCETNQQRLEKSIDQLNANAGQAHELLEVNDA